MRLRNLILMVLAVMCTSQVMAQSKRNVRKRPAKRTVVNNTKKPVDKTKDAKLPVDSQAVAPAAQTTAVPAAAAPAGSTATPAATPAATTPATTPATAAASATTPATTPAAPATPAAGEASLLPPPAPAVPQDRVDTIYYNKNWKVITNKAFASYYRYALYPANPTMAKEFKTYYIDGALQSEGSFLELDKNDDANSKFTDTYISYYKDGNVEEKKTYVDGKLNGEYSIYFNNGNINKHFLMSEGRRDGLSATFTEDGKICTLTPYVSDQPDGYYVVVDIDGNYSKYSLADKQPVLETPSPSEIVTEYKNGVAWPYYNKNGLIVGASNTIVEDIGGYRQIGLFLVNKSMINLDLDPSQIEIYSIKKDKRKEFEKISAQEYNDKIEKYVRRNSMMPAARNGNVNANLGAQFSNSSNTVKDFQARICRMRKLDDGTRMKYAEKEPTDLGYLERTTIHPGEVVYGYIYTDDRKGVDLFVKVKINGIDYLFEWDDSKK